MGVKYKNYAYVDLARRVSSGVVYEEKEPDDGLPPSCPTLAQLTPVFNSWSQDFSLNPDSDNLGAGWTPYHTVCLGRQNEPTTFVRGGLIQTGSDPILNVACGGMGDTSGDPILNYFSAIPFAVKDSIVSAVYDHSIYNAKVGGLGTNVGEFCVLARVNQVGVGFDYNVNVKCYAGQYQEVYNNAGVFLSAAAQIYRFQAGSAFLAGAAVPKMNKGEVLMLTAANFQFSPTIEAVCLKVYTAGVQRAAFTDAGGSRILTGSMGIGSRVDSNTPDNPYLYFNNFLAQQTGPNPT